MTATMVSAFTEKYGISLWTHLRILRAHLSLGERVDQTYCVCTCTWLCPPPQIPPVPPNTGREHAPHPIP